MYSVAFVTSFVFVFLVLHKEFFVASVSLQTQGTQACLRYHDIPVRSLGHYKQSNRIEREVVSLHSRHGGAYHEEYK